MYDFYRRAKVNEDPLTRVAKQFNVRDFLQYVLDNCKHLVTNAQTNVIANRGGKFPDQDDQNRAALMLHSTAVVGVVDMFEACVLQAEHSLASAFPGLDLSYVRENVTPARASDMEIRSREFASACGEDLHRQLTSLNQLDSELVAFARAESLRRWERIAGRNAKLRKLRRRVLYRNITHTVADQNLRVQRLCRRAMQLLLPTSS
jgi:hypothetical protein